jgi:hypothetical protein
MTKFRCALYERAPAGEVLAWETIMDVIEDGVEGVAQRLLNRGESALLRRLRREGGSKPPRVGEIFGGEVLARYLRAFTADVEIGVKERVPRHLPAVPELMEQLRRWVIRMGYAAVVESPSERAARARAASDALPRARALAALLRGIEVPRHDGGRNGHFHYGGPLAIAKVARGSVWLEQGVAEDLLGPIEIPLESISDRELDWEIHGALCRGPDGWRLMEVRAISPCGLGARGHVAVGRDSGE